ncbi:transcription factor SPT20 homolog [Scaptodrosophila lebanonensis]|uniref:Transcription factor SPT20 homolog n=1 Tax=Drosophila lebanonensis TaxID=7225 RepID=A0A6J2TWE0_DROLE|nr:transcription factor SPT20 homolog [Scaptodrosophila lebanonensis]
MQKRLILLVLAASLCACAHGAATLSTQAPATTAKPSGFSARSLDVSAAADEEEADDFETQAQTHLAYRQQQRPLYEYSEEDQEEAPRQVYINRNAKQQNNYLKANQKKPLSEESEEEEEVEEEPDRLSTLLSKSTFSCNDKNSGYYADESLSCEVFHYCQDNQRHSWICPEGFTFHQIHLICMPPSHDNICKQSSKYHIVNDYLYKPINLQEHQSKPNVTLRYSERYYPENYYEHERYDDEEEELPQPAPRPRVQHQQQQQQPQHHRQVAYHQPQPQPQQQQHQPQPQLQIQHAPQVRVQYQQQQQPQQQPATQIRHQPTILQHQHVPQPTTLAYRKPLPTTTLQPQLHQLQPQLHQQRLQTLAPTVTPTPYRFFTAAPALQHLQQHQQQVYRTPEEINISLQQRRPQVFIATSTPRYYEDEYLYERRK